MDTQRAVKEVLCETRKFSDNNYNLLRYTEDFGDMQWFNREISVYNNQEKDPNGNPNADLVKFSRDTLQSRIYQIVSGLEDGIYSFSVYVKAINNESGSYSIGATVRGLDGENKFFSKTAYIDGLSWRRICVYIEKNGKGDLVVYPAYRRIHGNNLNAIYLWGAQLEKIDPKNLAIKMYKGNDVIL